ncbi:tripartite tricarboxylate transporter substrate-binding protein [Rhodoferax sediminis]|uniref:tripartite tricarboxylate transporter substrate-binding protein n=1 Tax=Rhodoferax sediminis TaxID=2509614 RepID=UPI00143DEFD3
MNADLPLRSVGELVTYAKANADKLSFASAGLGSAVHLEGEYVMNDNGARMIHVPYKSDAEAMREVAVGTVEVGMTTAQFAIPLIATGKVRRWPSMGSPGWTACRAYRPWRRST